MKTRKRLGVIIACIVLALAAVAAVLSLNSFRIALRSAGFPSKGWVILDMGIDNNGNEYRVAVDYLNDSDAHMAYLSKGFGGFWRVEYSADTPASETGMVALGWMRVAGIKRFTVGDESCVEFEVHEAYCGKNAVKQIQIPPELLPPNVTVNILQGGSSFVIQFVSFGDAQMEIDAYEILKAAGCI